MTLEERLQTLMQMDAMEERQTVLEPSTVWKVSPDIGDQIDVMAIKAALKRKPSVLPIRSVDLRGTKRKQQFCLICDVIFDSGYAKQKATEFKSREETTGVERLKRQIEARFKRAAELGLNVLPHATIDSSEIAKDPRTEALRKARPLFEFIEIEEDLHIINTVPICANSQNGIFLEGIAGAILGGEGFNVKCRGIA